MKNLALKNLGVQELTSKEARETNGGIATVVAVGIIVVGVAIILGCIWPNAPHKWLRRRRRRRR